MLCVWGLSQNYCERVASLRPSGASKGAPTTGREWKRIGPRRAGGQKGCRPSAEASLGDLGSPSPGRRAAPGGLSASAQVLDTRPRWCAGADLRVRHADPWAESRPSSVLVDLAQPPLKTRTMIDAAASQALMPFRAWVGISAADRSLPEVRPILVAAS